MIDRSKKKNEESSIIHKKYEIHELIHDGPRSQIYTVAYEKSGRQLFRIMKMQTQSNKSEGIKNQINVICSLLRDSSGKIRFKPGFARLYEYGSENSTNYMVMDLYGPNLDQLMKLCGGKFSKRTTTMIGLQLIDRIEAIHQQKYLYVDFKPENFMVGLGRESYLIIAIDFAKAMLYKSKNQNIHIPFQNKCYDYDPLFASVNSHYGIQPSRRDDMESFLYFLLYILRGRLPWGRSEGTSKKEIEDDILEIKRRILPESLMKGLPLEFTDMIYYVKTLSFYEKPDYDLFRTKLWSVLQETDYEQLKKNIILYDWNERQSLDYEIYRGNPKIKIKSKENNTNEELVCSGFSKKDQVIEDKKNVNA